MYDADGNHQAVLRIDGTQVTYPLSQTKNTIIGRAFDCQITLNSSQDSSISKYHAKVHPLVKSGTWEICDRRSTNGTYVNGKRLSGYHTLQLGDRITFGQSPTVLIFEVRAISDDSQKPEFSPTKRTKLSETILSMITRSVWFPPIRISSNWQEFRKEGNFLTVVFFILSFALAAWLQKLGTIGENVSNGLIAGCLLFMSLVGIEAICGRYKPWWLIFGLALFTGGLTYIVYFQLKDNLAFHILWQQAFLKEAIKALPVLAIYFLGKNKIGKKLLKFGKNQIRILDPLDGILLMISSAIGLEIVESINRTETDIIYDILPSIGGDLVYSGIFGYYLGLSVITSNRKAWEIIAIGYFAALILHIFIYLVDFYSDEGVGNVFIHIIEYLILIACILRGKEMSQQK